MSKPDKRQVESVVVKLLHHKLTDRGMILAPFETRCVRLGEIHELVTTDQSEAAQGDAVDRVGFLGFIEITRAGVIEVGDQVVHRDRVLGHVLGFDESHFPNHYNILVSSRQILAADDANLATEERITFRLKLQEEV
jgi:L-arabinose 1-dehydrogenase